MPKRTWNDSNGSSENPSSQYSSKRVATGSQTARDAQPLAYISRNIKACTICRKQKIKCLIDESGPPCRRCYDKKLQCVISRNLQSIIDEKTQYVGLRDALAPEVNFTYHSRLSEAVLSDLGHLYKAVKEMRSAAGMPDLPPLQTSLLHDHEGPLTSHNSLANLQFHAEEGSGPSCDNSPKPIAEDDQLPYVPIHSLYALTKMRALRSPDSVEQSKTQPISDFISRGAIPLADAERLFALYRDRLDGFIYSVGCRYASLDELRQRSPILSAATLTVAALHDPNANRIYGVCSSELRRLIEKSVLQRQVDRDYFRALSIAAYWLSDLSWTVSGHAIRRATECNIHNSYSQAIKDQNEDTADYARIWSILYICDQHLAMLYGRPAIVQDEWSTQDWEGFLQCSFATKQDERLMSQVELMGILRNVRQLFGPDKGEAIPRIHLNQIGHFNRQLDSWVTKWTTRLPEQYPIIGAFPRKGVLLHYHFAQLYLYSHVFRGLSSSIPSYFFDAASIATTAASSIIDFLLSDPDVSAGVVGMPSYLLSMTAFTCMFLAKVAHKFGDSLVKHDQVLSYITRLVSLFRSLSMGKWHLANLMIGGLEKVTTIFASGNEPNSTQAEANATAMLGNENGLFGQRMMADVALPRLDGNPCPIYDMTFGLSPIFEADPSLLDAYGYVSSMTPFTSGDF